MEHVELESETREYRGQQFEIIVYFVPAEYYRNTSNVDRREVCIDWKDSSDTAEGHVSVDFAASVPVEDRIAVSEKITVPVLGWTLREEKTEVVEETMPYDEHKEYVVSEWKKRVDDSIERIERSKR